MPSKKNNTDLNVNLSFKQIKDFHPEHVVQQVPQLRNLLAMRNLLKDLKANVLDQQNFRKELENIIRDKKGFQSLLKELKRINPDLALDDMRGGD